jgi:hypothetical protein
MRYFIATARLLFLLISLDKNPKTAIKNETNSVK